MGGRVDPLMVSSGLVICLAVQETLPAMRITKSTARRNTTTGKTDGGIRLEHSDLHGWEPLTSSAYYGKTRLELREQKKARDDEPDSIDPSLRDYGHRH